MLRIVLGSFGLMLAMLGAVGCSTLREKYGYFKHVEVPKLGPQEGEDQYERAGSPRDVHCAAHPTDTGRYTLYRVGGGAASSHKGEGPTCDEGTWGWDYSGLCLPSKVELLWHHGRKQGGVGAYASDGPHPVKHLKERHEHREAAAEAGKHEGGGHNKGGGHE